MSTAVRTAGVGRNHRPADFLRPVVLLLLAEQPTYGYDLLDRLQRFGFPRDAGGAYRTLHALERDGLVRARTRPSASGPDRQIYHVTKRGRHELDAEARLLIRTRMDVAQFLSRHAGLGSAAHTGTHSGLSPVTEALVRLVAS